MKNARIMSRDLSEKCSASYRRKLKKYAAKLARRLAKAKDAACI